MSITNPDLGWDPNRLLEEGLTPRFCGLYKRPNYWSNPAGPAPDGMTDQTTSLWGYNVTSGTGPDSSKTQPDYLERGSFVWDWPGLDNCGPQSVPVDQSPWPSWLGGVWTWYGLPPIGELWFSEFDYSGDANNTGTDVSGGLQNIAAGQYLRVITAGYANFTGYPKITTLLYQVSSAPSYNSSLEGWKIPVSVVSGGQISEYGCVIEGQGGLSESDQGRFCPDYLYPFSGVELEDYFGTGPKTIQEASPRSTPFGQIFTAGHHPDYWPIDFQPVLLYTYEPNPNSGGGNGGEDPGDGGGDPGDGGGVPGDGGEDPGGGLGGGSDNPPMNTTIQSSPIVTTIEGSVKRSAQSIYLKILQEMEQNPGVLGNSPHAEYKELLRFLIARFSQLTYLNEEQKVMPVKCTHARPERAIAKLNQQQNIILPTATISQTSIEESDTRRRVSPMLIHETHWDDIKQKATRVLRIVDRPVTLVYTLNLWAKYLEDMDQLAEQVRLMFNPNLAITTPYEKNTPTFLTAETDNSSMVLADREDRIVRKSFTIKVETYIKNPRFQVTSTGEVQRFNIDMPIVDC